MDYKDYKLKGQNVVDIPFVCYIIDLRFRGNIVAKYYRFWLNNNGKVVRHTPR